MTHERNIRRLAALFAACLLAAPGLCTAADLEVFTVTPAFARFDTGGQTVTVRGVGFTASTTVSFEGTPAAAVTLVSSRMLTVTVPVLGSEQVSTVTVDDPSTGSDKFYPFLHTGPVLYVSASTGSDGNNGGDPNNAKLTIINGLAQVDGTTPTEVRVAEGTYPEWDIALWTPVVLSCGWSPDFTTRAPDAHVTVIDGQGQSFVMRSAGIRGTSVLDGCTLKNGFRDGFGGGGLAITSDSTVVNNNVIVGNGSSFMGGGVYFTVNTSYGGTPTFSNNVILGNRAYNKAGGGIAVYPNYNTQEEVRVNVTGNEIVGNRSYSGRGGGFGLTTSSYAGYNNGTLKMAENTFAENMAKAGGGGAVTFFTFGDLYSLSMNGNLFTGNAALGSGGGFSFEGAGGLDGYISCNTFAGNSAVPGLTGGLLVDGAMTLIPGFSGSDSILWNNPGGDAGGQAVNLLTYSASGTALPGPGNITGDPGFVSGPLGDHYLAQVDANLPVSPAVDAGSATAADLSLESLTTRVDQVPDAGIADMGYHYGPADGNSVDPLAILRLDPDRGDLNGAEWVLIRGTGFDPGASVDFDGSPAASVRFLGNTRLLARPAPHALGPVDVTVTNPDASFVDANSAYTYADTQPPEWISTVGIVSVTAGQDCARSAILQWNPAVDATSNPVTYEIHREECIVSTNTSVPCDNFGFFPNASNVLVTTQELHYTDADFAASGADKKWLYAVRARDAAMPPNREWNFAKRLAEVGADPNDVAAPPAVGETLGWVGTSLTDLAWSAPVGASQYGLYRELSVTPFTDPNTIVPFLVLDSTNNDADGNGVVDSSWVESADPAANTAFFYRVTSMDPCGNENISDLLP